MRAAFVYTTFAFSSVQAEGLTFESHRFLVGEPTWVEAYSEMGLAPDSSGQLDEIRVGEPVSYVVHITGAASGLDAACHVQIVVSQPDSISVTRPADKRFCRYGKTNGADIEVSYTGMSFANPIPGLRPAQIGLSILVGAKKVVFSDEFAVAGTNE